MKGRRFFFLLLLITFLSPILFYKCNYLDITKSFNLARSSCLQLFGKSEPPGAQLEVNVEEKRSLKADGLPNANKERAQTRRNEHNLMIKCCSSENSHCLPNATILEFLTHQCSRIHVYLPLEDRDVIADSKHLRSNPQRRLNYVNQREEQEQHSGRDSMDYHLDKTLNRPIMSSDDELDDELDVEDDEEEEEEIEVVSTYQNLVPDIPTSFPAILAEGGENPRQTAEVISKKNKRRGRGGGRGRRRGGGRGKRKHHRRHQRRSPRKRNVQEVGSLIDTEEAKDVTEAEVVVLPCEESKESDNVMTDELDEIEEIVGEVKNHEVRDKKKKNEPKTNPSPPLEGIMSGDADDNFEDVEVGEVLVQLGHAIKKTAVVISNHAVQYPKDVCVVIVFVLLLIKLATWLSGGYRQQTRNMVPMTHSVPLLSTSASGGTSFSEGGLKPVLQTSYTCIPQTLESVRRLLPAESQPVIPCGMLKGGYQTTSTSETCNLRGIPDTFTILKNMPADIDVADIYLDTFRRMALQAGKMKTANLLKESQLFLEYRRNSYLKNNLSQNGQISSSRVIPTDSVLANISTDSQN